jgi:electron transport complex protein RnfB
MMTKITPQQIDDILPQTQCGLCGYGGCLPYAQAMAFEKAPINLCPPGGVETLRELAELLEQDPTPYLADMQEKAKPKLLAIIRENECIGCTKCIQACPVDAILGSAKQMHTVIADECTGCELCLAPCPVDCIDMLEITDIEITDIAFQKNENKEKANHARMRFNARQNRLEKENTLEKEKKLKSAQTHTQSQAIKKNYIEAAIARAKAKKSKQS